MNNETPDTEHSRKPTLEKLFENKMKKKLFFKK